jgi:hypothetical protein
MTETADEATVKVWSGGRHATYDHILDEEPDVYEVDVFGEDTYHVPHEDHVHLAEDIDHHGTYAFDVECESDVQLIVETNDSFHAPVDGFTDGRPIEGGLRYEADSEVPPFKCEIWGRIRMRVEDDT